MRTRFIAVAVAGVLAAACSDANTPTAPGVAAPLASFSDGAHNSGNPNFFFRPPIVRGDGPFAGVFDGSLDAVVDICWLDGTRCAPVAHFTTSSRGDRGESERVRAGEDHYIVNWHTRDYDLDVSKTYRICVSVKANRLGHADVDVVGSNKELRNVNTNEYVGLRDDRTLPIKFRIEAGAVAPGAFVDDGCIGAMRPAEIRGRKCLVTGEHDEDDDHDGHDEDDADDEHEDGGQTGSSQDAHDGHDHDGHDEDDDDHDRDHDSDNHQGRCKHGDDHAAGIAGWPISLSGTDDQGAAVSLTTDTGEQGKYSFTGLRPGSYTVCEGVKEGFVQVFPSAGASCPGDTFGYSLVLGSGQVVKHKDFGNQAGAPPTATLQIQGKKLLAGDLVGLSGWVIRLFDGTGNVVAEATTDANGDYTLTVANPPGASYTLCEELPLGVGIDAQVSPVLGPPGTVTCANGTVGYVITVTAGQGLTVTGMDFVNQLAG